MKIPTRRSMPLAAAAASLTFGACGDDGNDTGPGSQSSTIQGAIESFSQVVCQKYADCMPDELMAEFSSVRACVEYYLNDYMAIVDELEAQGGDLEGAPEACVDAAIAYFDCIRDYYAAADCSVLEDSNDGYYSSDGYYTDSGEDDSASDVCDAEEDRLDAACEGDIGYTGDYYSSGG